MPGTRCTGCCRRGSGGPGAVRCEDADIGDRVPNRRPVVNGAAREVLGCSRLVWYHPVTPSCCTGIEVRTWHSCVTRRSPLQSRSPRWRRAAAPARKAPREPQAQLARLDRRARRERTARRACRAPESLAWLVEPRDLVPRRRCRQLPGFRPSSPSTATNSAPPSADWSLLAEGGPGRAPRAQQGSPAHGSDRRPRHVGDVAGARAPTTRIARREASRTCPPPASTTSAADSRAPPAATGTPERGRPHRLDRARRSHWSTRDERAIGVGAPICPCDTRTARGRYRRHLRCSA